MSENPDEVTVLTWKIPDNVNHEQIEMVRRLMEAMGGSAPKTSELVWTVPSSVNAEHVSRVDALITKVEFYASMPYPLNQESGPSFVRTPGFGEAPGGKRSLQWQIPDGISDDQIAHIRSLCEEISGTVNVYGRVLVWNVPETVSYDCVSEVEREIFDLKATAPPRLMALEAEELLAEWKASK